MSDNYGVQGPIHATNVSVGPNARAIYGSGPSELLRDNDEAARNPKATVADESTPSVKSSELETSVKVFISYAHEDQELRKKLEEHLSPLTYSGKITIWQDQEIPAGANWEDQISTHLDEAGMILLLVSASFIASKYCWSKEVRTALERHKAGTARVIPIILKPALWKATPLGQLQVLPTEAKAVTQWNDPDDAFENVVQGIQEVLLRLASKVGDSA